VPLAADTGAALVALAEAVGGPPAARVAWRERVTPRTSPSGSRGRCLSAGPSIRRAWSRP
jgi:hypothetical protein